MCLKIEASQFYGDHWFVKKENLNDELEACDVHARRAYRESQILPF